MRGSDSQLKLFVPKAMRSTRLAHAVSNPGERYRWSHMTTVLREWKREFLHRDINPLELTAAEIVGIEARVRKELYP